MEAFLNLNNEGVEHLLDGNYADAEKSLKAAFMQVGELHSKCTALMEQQQNKKMEKNQKNTTTKHQNFKNLVLQTRRVPDSAPMSQGQNYMYRYAIVGFLDPNVEEETDATSSDGLTAMVVFNIALCHHCNEKQYSRSTSSRWKVLRFYRLAFRALQTKSWQFHYTFKTMTIIGILNNMGVIHHKLRDFLESDSCFEKLQSLDVQDRLMLCFPDTRRGVFENLKSLVQIRPAPAA